MHQNDTIVSTIRLYKKFEFYQTEDGFWSDFAVIKHDYTYEFSGPTIKPLI